ncbi:hypothetical protein HHI36_014166 [Cryptolaemus montrouzieri]|uniref:STING ligand-binding domain-containing protein n=1 Tax=Cryptolaemus montrouzieri TaxID=559131 RepID=A0ABD2N2D4_9CUCU
MTKEPINSEERPEYFVVSKMKNGDMFYPKNIPNPRRGHSIWMTALLSSVFFIGASVCNSDIYYTIEAINYGLLAMLSMEIIYRIILALEELLYHFNSLYGNSYKKLAKRLFSFSWIPLISVFISVIIFIIFFMKHGLFDLTKMSCASLGLIICGLLLLRKIMNIEKAPIYNSLTIQKEGLDYGTGMALSFFYGYLNIILPRSGKESTNLKEEIEIYTDTHGVTFPVPRLILLIPQSCICLDSLASDKFPNIEACPSLRERTLNVAGVKNRVYKNSVYKISDEKRKRKICVCAEYATPLLTFKTGWTSIGPQAKNFKKHRKEIVQKFYSTLRDLLKNNLEITDLCELIYYDDIDENGKFRDISQFIMSRIRRLEREAKNLNDNLMVYVVLHLLPYDKLFNYF